MQLVRRVFRRRLVTKAATAKEYRALQERLILTVVAYQPRHNIEVFVALLAHCLFHGILKAGITPYSQLALTVDSVHTMNSSNPPSVLSALGYQVLSLELGVYVLTADESSDERIIALLLAAGRPAASSFNVDLFLEPVPDGVAALDIVQVWQALDARRFEESGLVPRVLELGPVDLASIKPQVYDRPVGGTRAVLELPTGDVLCLS